MKKIYALILAVAMLISLFGCENGKDPVGTTDNPETTVAPTETTEAPVETTVAPTTEPVETTETPTEAPTEAPTTAPTEAPTEPAKTQHKHSYTSKTTAPSCETNGYTTYTCACGHSYTGNETKATGHNYTTTTVAPTATEDGYDLHKCTVCGREYRDNPVPKTGSTSEDNSDHTGMRWESIANEGRGGWVPHDCASKGHFFGKLTVIQEETCCQHYIAEHTCEVVGCDAVERIESNGYSPHTRSVNDITGYYNRYVVRRADGLGWYFDNEAAARAKAKEIVNAYKNGECEWWLVSIWCDTRPIMPEDYTCLVCGKTLNDNNYMWDSKTDEHVIWKEYYDKDNQP